MPFPNVLSATESIEGSGTTTHTVDLPTTINVGDLLVGVVVTGRKGASHSWPSGWTKIIDSVVNVDEVCISVAYRQADGGEGASITVTTPDVPQSAHVVYRITGHADPSVRAPSANSATGVSSEVDPPLHTPSGGAADFLWLAVGGLVETVSINTFPANYSLNQINLSSGSSAGNSIRAGFAGRNLNAASEDPGFIKYSGTNDFVAVTVSIPPTAVVAGHPYVKRLGGIPGMALNKGVW